jgi:hypothetical protein
LNVLPQNCQSETFHDQCLTNFYTTDRKLTPLEGPGLARNPQLKIGQPQITTQRHAMKKLIVFDLDGTLAESKTSLDTEMSLLLHDLLGIVKVAVISGGDWPQFKKQVLSNLPMMKAWIIYSCYPRVEPNSTNTQGIGKKYIQKISLPIKREKLSIL